MEHYLKKRVYNNGSTMNNLKRMRIFMKAFKRVIIVFAIATVMIFYIGCMQNSGKNGSTNDLPSVVGYVSEGIDVPEEVLAAAKTKVAEIFDMEREDFPDYYYTNWRIENLKYSYSYLVTGEDKAIIYSDDYKATGGMKIEIYQMNFELLTESPKNIVFAGGMYITGENWVMPDYPNSRPPVTYLIYFNILQNISICRSSSKIIRFNIFTILSSRMNSA